MEKIFDIAKDKEQSWGTLAQAIDDNFSEVKEELALKFDKTAVKQTTGTSTTEVMSQDAVSKELARVETEMSIMVDAKPECVVLTGKRINNNGSIGDSANNNVYVLNVSKGDVVSVTGRVTYACDYILYKNFDGSNLSNIVQPWSSADHYKTNIVTYNVDLIVPEDCYACFGSLSDFEISIHINKILSAKEVDARLVEVEQSSSALPKIEEAISHDVDLIQSSTSFRGKLSNDQSFNGNNNYITLVKEVKKGQNIYISGYGFYSILWSMYKTFDGTTNSFNGNNGISPWGAYIGEKNKSEDTLLIEQDCYLAACFYVANGDEYSFKAQGYLTAKEIDESLKTIDNVSADIENIKDKTFGKEPTSKVWNAPDIYYAPLKRLQAWGANGINLEVPSGSRVAVRLLRGEHYKDLPFDIMCDEEGSPTLYPITLRNIEDEEWHVVELKGKVTTWGFIHDGYDLYNEQLRLEVDALNSIADRVVRLENDLYNKTKLYTIQDALLAWMNGEKFPVGLLGDSTTDGVGTSNWDANTNSHCTCDGIAYGVEKVLTYRDSFATTVNSIPISERTANIKVSFYSTQFFVKEYTGASFDDASFGNESNWLTIDYSEFFGKGDWICEEAYPYLLEQLLRNELNNTSLRVYNMGYSGASFNNLKERLKEVLSGAYSDVKMVGIELGINDRGGKESDIDYYNSLIENLKYYVEYMISVGITPFMVTTQTWLQNGDNGSGTFNPISQNYVQILCNKAKYEVAKMYGLEVIDMNSWGAKILRCSEYPLNSITQDSLHFRDIGHKLEADYLFTCFIPWILNTNFENKIYVGVTNHNAKSGIITANYIYGQGAETNDGFRKQINKNKGNTNDVLIYDAYVFVNESGAYNVSYHTSIASGYIVIDGDGNNKISIVDEELYLGKWDMGLHHVQVYTGTSNIVAFKGFLLEKVAV